MKLACMDYITEALEERLNSKFEALTTGLDALTDNLLPPPACVESRPTAPLRDAPPQQDTHTEIYSRRFLAPVHGGLDADLEDDAGFFSFFFLRERMMLVMHHDSHTLTLVLQLLFMFCLLMIEIVSVMLHMFHWMMVLGVLKFPYHRSPARVVLKIIWSGR